MNYESVTDPGFPVGGVDLIGGGRGLPMRLCFANFVCQNERIWTLGGACPGHAPSRSANVNDSFNIYFITKVANYLISYWEPICS